MTQKGFSRTCRPQLPKIRGRIRLGTFYASIGQREKAVDEFRSVLTKKT
jgi:hypothetical protein